MKSIYKYPTKWQQHDIHTPPLSPKVRELIHVAGVISRLSVIRLLAVGRVRGQMFIGFIVTGNTLWLSVCGYTRVQLSVSNWTRLKPRALWYFHKEPI